MKRKFKLGIIGAGNLGIALKKAVLKGRLYRPSEIGTTRRGGNNKELVRVAETILLCVKPIDMRGLLEEIHGEIKNHLLITVAAGLDTEFYSRFLPEGTRLIRAMPNRPAIVGEAATALFATPTATKADCRSAEKIFGAAGSVTFIEEERWMDVITALSGSGPAFVALFAKSLIEAAEQQGLPKKIAHQLTIQTILGSAQMLQKSKEPLDSEIQKVASKGGTTEAGLKILQKGSFEKLIQETIKAATERAQELRKEN